MRCQMKKPVFLAMGAFLLAIVLAFSVPSAQACCVDVDDDGYGVLNLHLCDHPNELDCDDSDPNVNPGAEEVCNGIDDNCDEIIDDVDADLDGYIAEACGGEDCDDSDPNVNPDAEEVCNGTDDDCDGIIDNVDNDLDTHIDWECGGYDCDDDPTDDPSACSDCTCGATECAPCARCIHPEAAEGPCCGPTCFDKIDNDCDGLIDKFSDPDCSLLQCSIPPSPEASVVGPGAVMKAGAWTQVGLFLIPVAQILLLRRFLRRKS